MTQIEDMLKLTICLRELRQLYSLLELRRYRQALHDTDEGEVVNLIGNFFARYGFFQTSLECYGLVVRHERTTTRAAALGNSGTVFCAFGCYEYLREESLAHRKSGCNGYLNNLV